MPSQLDHIILEVNSAPASVEFYARVLGFTHEGEDGPFTVVRVNEELGARGMVHQALSE